MKIHILTDNRVKKRGILAEHGLSVFIENKNTNVLFDTGQSDVYCRNASKMGVDLSKTDYIVISHGHDDHSGGLIHFPEVEKFPAVYVNEAAFAKRYALNPDGNTYREIGIRWSPKDRADLKNSMIFIEKSVHIAADIMICGEIPNTTDFEDIPRGYYTQSGQEKVMDIFKDEQMLIYDTDKGLSIFLGCSHPGVINCLNYALRQYPGKKIYSVVAGMHLEDVSPLRLQMTIQSMIDLDIQKVVPLHCTGITAICEMQRFMGDRCIPLCAGDSLEI